jgi:hypothetical protein
MEYISITELQSNGHISDEQTLSFKLVPRGLELYSFGRSIPAQCVRFFVSAVSSHYTSPRSSLQLHSHD